VTFSLSESAEQSRKIQRLDPLLVAALSLAFLFCLQGITWGRVECWNRSQIALLGLRALRPGNYMKPPFHTYLNHVFVIWPITGALKIAQVPAERMKVANSAKLIGSRLVTIALYLGTIALAYSFSRRSYGRFSAVIIAFAFATSAGFVTYAHFLTADTPLLFWMLAALWAADRLASAPSARNYAIAGFLTGISIATKYNGLAVEIALLVAHFFATKGASLRSIILSRQLGIGLGMVPLGFLFGCPTLLYEPKKFWEDFIYNYTVTPLSPGQPDRANYLGALGRIPEIVGIPGAILIAGLAILSCILILRRRDLSDAATRGFALSSAVFLVYFLKVGTFPRAETRYGLPAIPFLILMIGPALQTLERRKWIFALLLPVLIYNCLCSYLTGKRFNDDPRLKAQLWVVKNVPPGSVIESSGTSPHWSKLPNFDAREIDLGRPDRPSPPARDITDFRLPNMPGRAELFRKVFPEWVQPLIADSQVPTKGYSPPPLWRSAIRITSAFIRRIIACPSKLCADITVTFLPGNSPTPSCSMPAPQERRHGFIRARSIPCADASLFCSGKVEDPG
jgi:Dolichyl-phosphate-mannose-protein mannosyltransferase